MIFPTDLGSIKQRIEEINPAQYAATRNYGNGEVTGLSPYISRGVISTKQVMEFVLQHPQSSSNKEKLLQELAWRDYWQQVWVAKGDQINFDLKQVQSQVTNHQLATNIIEAKTGINVIDKGITDLYKTGYMHNHMRMYVAALACNIAQSQWLTPAQWMYAHLLDGDWASNALSWQWVAGANANKKYYANQENINKYFGDNQKGSYLDCEYDQFESLKVPPELSEYSDFNLDTLLPLSPVLSIDKQKPTCIYTYYNLDPDWHTDENVNRVFILEPSFFERYPIANKPLQFAIDLSKNIENIQLFVGEFAELQPLLGPEVFFKEHPTNTHFIGIEEARDWMFNVTGYYRSFFAFWKKCKKELKG